MLQAAAAKFTNAAATGSGKAGGKGGEPIFKIRVAVFECLRGGELPVNLSVGRVAVTFLLV